MKDLLHLTHYSNYILHVNEKSIDDVYMQFMVL
jgi:hypothetical protein